MQHHIQYEVERESLKKQRLASLRAALPDDTPLVSDVRILAATNRDLAAMMASGDFRQDLYYRLAVFPIDIPPLRKRTADILPLAEYFLAMHAQRLTLPVPTLADSAEARLQAYAWPGNTRELENAIHFALLVNGSGLIEADDISLTQ